MLEPVSIAIVIGAALVTYLIGSWVGQRSAQVYDDCCERAMKNATPWSEARVHFTFDKETWILPLTPYNAEWGLCKAVTNLIVEHPIIDTNELWDKIAGYCQEHRPQGVKIHYMEGCTLFKPNSYMIYLVVEVFTPELWNAVEAGDLQLAITFDTNTREITEIYLHQDGTHLSTRRESNKE